MRIASTKLMPRSTETSTEKSTETDATGVAGVIMAVPETKIDWSGGGANAKVAEGMYVFPSSSFSALASDSATLPPEVAGIAKSLSVQLASELHPHLGTGVRAGWIVIGALSLLNRAKTRSLDWHEVAFEGGGLALETIQAASDAMPDDFQFDSSWAEGASYYLEATEHVAKGGDANEFVIGKTLDQSLPMDYSRKLLALAMAAQDSDAKFSGVSANAIQVKVDVTE